MIMVTGLFDTYHDAKLAVEQLRDAGISLDGISIVFRTEDAREINEQDGSPRKVRAPVPALVRLLAARVGCSRDWA